MVRKKKKKKNVFARSLLLAFCIILFLLLGIYVYLGLFFRSHFFYRTRIEDIDVGGMDAKKAVDEIRMEVKGYFLSMHDRDGNQYQIPGLSFSYDYEPQGEEEKLIAAQNPLLWPVMVAKERKLEMSKSITYDEELLKEAVFALDCFKEERMQKPTNAAIRMTEDGYELAAETQGSSLIADRVFARVKAAVEMGESEFTFTDDLYEKPEITSENPVLSECMAKIQAFFGAEITYDLGEDREVVDKSIISKWITVDENYNVSFDETKAAAYVQSLASKYNTYGDEREFVTAKGDTVTIGGGDYGWVIDKEAELGQLVQEVQNGEVKTREPVYSQTAVSRNHNDIGDTYIEVDYTGQHLWYYENGAVKLESDFVSGNISKGNGSPDGVFKIVYKKSPAVLKGEDYASDVTYFMPFAYNVGFHDASWRGKFGGNIYKTSGSHGCINLPGDAAKEFYETVAVGTPVIAYYRDKVVLTAENAKISNAYSYRSKKEAKSGAADAPQLPVPGEGQRIAEDGSIEAAE